jgi:penicillin-binding protein 1A
LLFLALAAGLSWSVAGLTKDLPNYDVLSRYVPPTTTRVQAGDGELVAQYSHENRIFLPIAAVPDMMKQAFISAEDKNFYTHTGLDYFGIARALMQDVQNAGTGQPLVGASTITQQVARNFLLTLDQTWDRKVTEAVLGLRIEQAYSKDKILELYLNEIPLGLGSYGVASAALTYFNKSVSELTLPQVAFLAGLPKGPSNYDPYKYPDRATDRRNYVIDRMVENGYVSAADGEAAKAAPLGVKPGYNATVSLSAANYFTEEVRRQLVAMYGENTAYEGGLSVRTSLDPTLQVEARQALMNGLINFDQAVGWRGPVTHLDDLGSDWGAKVAGVHALSDVPEWRLAVVTAVNAQAATIGLQPGRIAGTGAVDPARDTGTIAFADMRWAHWAPGARGARGVSGASDVVKVGDVVYVQAVAGTPGRYQLRQVPEIEGGMVVMDPHTGRVLAMVGGFSFDLSQFNRATQAYRQPGSSFKPIVYSAALDNGYLPTSIIDDEPISIDQGPGMPPWTPDNYSKDFLGPSTLRTGVEQSRNVMTVRLAQDIGMPLIAEYARRFGVVNNLPQVLSMALGAADTTVLKMVAGYSVFPNGGKAVTPTLIDRIQDRYGNTIYRGDSTDICADCNADSWHGQSEPSITNDAQQVIPPTTAYQMISILQGVVQRGTGVAAKVINKPIAGKTGTTSDNKDAWFIGFTPNLVTGLYIGYDNPKSLGGNTTGGSLATPIFTEFMQQALVNQPAVDFKVPPGITFAAVDLHSGLPEPQGTPGAIMEAFKAGTDPSATNLPIIGLASSAPALSAQVYSVTPPPGPFGIFGPGRR